MLIRTDFSDDTSWRDTAPAAMAPAGRSGRRIRGSLAVTIAAVLGVIGSGPPNHVFLTHLEDSVLVVDPVRQAPGTRPIARSEVRPTQRDAERAAQNTLPIAPTDVDDFARSVDPDGNYRGVFRHRRPPAPAPHELPRRPRERGQGTPEVGNEGRHHTPVRPNRAQTR